MDNIPDDEDSHFFFPQETEAASDAPHAFSSAPLDHEVIDPPLYAAAFAYVPMPYGGLSSGGTKRVALTFDDGPSAYTPAILDILSRYDAKATFCVVGSRVNNYKNTIIRAYGMDCEIIGHSWSHESLTSMSYDGAANDIRRTANAISNVIGKKPRIYRPPYGNVNDTVRSASRAQGAGIIMWSVDTLDWSSRNATKVYNVIMSEVRDGSIILCHDLYPSTVEAVRMAIPELIRRGYSLVTVSELLGFTADNPPAPGKTYFNK